MYSTCHHVDVGLGVEAGDKKEHVATEVGLYRGRYEAGGAAHPGEKAAARGHLTIALGIQHGLYTRMMEGGGGGGGGFEGK